VLSEIWDWVRVAAYFAAVIWFLSTISAIRKLLHEIKMELSAIRWNQQYYARGGRDGENDGG